MVCVFHYTFHGGLSQAAEKPLPAVGRSCKFRQGRHVRLSAWVSLWSHLHRKAGGPWMVTGHSRCHRHIPLLGVRPGAKDKLLLEENQQQSLWQLRGHRVAHAMRQTRFSLLAHMHNSCLAIISGLSVGLSWSHCPPSVSRRWAARGAAPLGHCRAHFLPLRHVYPQIWYAGCACPPGRGKEMAPYTPWSFWGTVSRLPSSGLVPSLLAADRAAPAVHRLQMLLERMAGMNKYLGD